MAKVTKETVYDQLKKIGEFGISVTNSFGYGIVVDSATECVYGVLIIQTTRRTRRKDGKKLSGPYLETRRRSHVLISPYTALVTISITS